MTYNGIERPDYTPDYITELKPDEVFVFGSNLAGMHGGGAAWIAYRQFGAVMGQGVGLQGQSYAIPTMQGGVETIKPYVDEFIAFARQHAELFFFVTRIGCGIAGFRDDEIAPLFANACGVANICLPKTFVKHKQMTKTIKVFIEKSEHGFSAYMEDNSLDYNLFGEGKTMEEAINDFNESYKGMREYYERNNKKFDEIDYEFCYDSASI